MKSQRITIMSKEKETINLKAWVKSISSCESAYIPGLEKGKEYSPEEIDKMASQYCLLTIATYSARNDFYGDNYQQSIHVVVKREDAPFWSKHLCEGSLTLSVAPVKPSEEE